MEYQVRTKWGTSPQGKRRVYFTCHPADFQNYFEKICEDVFKTQDCAIYYAKDAAQEYEKEEELEWDQVNLVIIPISYRLLTEPNRAMDRDFMFAMEKHVPVLPIMMEPGLDVLFRAKFGSMEYLDRENGNGDLEGYEEKLGKYLQAILISDELAAKVRAAFDAYVFLSYRKKDRKYADELMRLIHSNPACRDVAVWYDEYLIPGEDFEDTIRNALHKSNFFAMVITPNLTEEGNYVQKIEYPEAIKAKKEIFPVEMQPTDGEKLRAMFENLPEVIPGNENAALYDRLAKILAQKGKLEMANDPNHNFLIGLAYLDGIDVEKNSDRALELITASAKAGLYEAAKKLSQVYHEGIGVKRDYAQWEEWTEKSYELAKNLYAEDSLELNDVKEDLATCYAEVGKFHKMLELGEEIYEYRRKAQGETALDTLITLNNIAYCYNNVGNYPKALELMEKTYECAKATYGEEHQNTVSILSNLATIHCSMGNYAKAIELEEEALKKERAGKDENHPFVQKCLCKLALYHAKLGDFGKAIEMESQVYAQRKQSFGDDHPHVLLSANNLGSYYAETGNLKPALELLEMTYEKRKNILGENHPDTLTTLNNLANYTSKAGDYEKALKLSEMALEGFQKNFGENHPNTLLTKANLAYVSAKFGEREKGIEMLKEVSEKLKSMLGEGHPIIPKLLGKLQEITDEKED